MSSPQAMRNVAQLILAAVLLGVAVESRAQSDEPWVVRAALPVGTRPLLALIVDTSAAMAEVTTARVPYDPGHDYAADAAAPCDPGRVYWRRGPGPAPDCGSPASLPLDSADAERGFRCLAGRSALARTGTYVASRAAQWSAHGPGGYWHEPLPGDEGAIECRADRGVHGAGDGPWYAAQGPAGPWSRHSEDELHWDAAPLSDSYVFLTGNYLNYLAAPAAPVMTSHYARLTSMVVSAASSVDELDLALLRLSHDGLTGDDAGRGGMVVRAPVTLPAAAASIGATLADWSPAGPAPLAEAMVEAAAWLTGGPVLFGDTAHAAPGEPLHSASDARDLQRPDAYRTPFTTACRPVSLGLLSAGLPSADGGAATAAARLPGLGQAASACTTGCLAALAQWLWQADLLPAVPGRQHAPLFIAAPLPATAVLREAAAVAGAPVLDLADPLALVMMIARALQQDAMEAAGARLSAAVIDMTVGDPAVYFGLSLPAAAPRWAGNVRKYRWRPAAGTRGAPGVIDADGDLAFDESGLALRQSSRSLWSATTDGADLRLGGAAAALPLPAMRRIYTDLGPAPLTDPGNRVSATNPALTREALGLAPRDPRSRAELIDWMLGADAFDADGDGRRDEPRHELGDPGLSPPTIIRYGGADEPALVFATSNDGLLHALNDADGGERWAFLPRSQLSRMSEISTTTPTAARRHGLEGHLTRHVFDADGDGRITPRSGDHAWLMVGLGRGGAGYYALDVTDPDRPRLLWSLGGAAASALGEAWPAAVIVRMRLDDRRQGQHRLVAIIAGGHDPGQAAWPRPHDQRGARLLILDAESGEVLWQASGAAGDSADLTLEGLTASLPSAPRVLDVDGDGDADTLYLLGIAGHLWRIGFAPGAEPSSRATATLLGHFGEADDPGRPPRRFYSTPDVSYDMNGGRPRFIVSFGSGWLARPRDASIEDRFYAVFDPTGPSDRGVPTGASQALHDDDLFDVTPAPHTAPRDARGWLLRLVTHGRGEKTAGPSLTFDRGLRFATYQPLATDPGQPCGPPPGLSRLYTLDVRSGRPLNWIGDQPVPAEDLAVPGPPPGLRIALPPRPVTAACAPGGCAAAPVGLIGGRPLGLDFRNDPVKTTWRRLAP